MKPSRMIYTVLFIFCYLSSIYSYDQLRVQDPKSTWRYGQGTIEKAVLSVKPVGLYMEYGLYLTFSARGMNFTSSDTLEVQFWFDLPENAIVCDSWLWIEEEIIKGKIMDKWTASSIYENIVNRQRDPSILFKRSSRNYELRIYPMAGNSQRKVKITYLVPAEISAQNIYAPLPNNLLKTSRYPVNLSLLSRLGELWNNPRILEYPEIEFADRVDSSAGAYQEALILNNQLQNTINFSLDSPIKNGIYLNRIQGDDNIYQMAFLPSDALNLQSSNNIAILIDYNPSNCSFSRGDIWNNLKSSIQSSISAKDSINLIFSNVTIKRASENWIPGDSASIENLFNELSENSISNYNNLPSLIANGIDFVKSKGSNGSILLISASDQEGDYQVANQLISDLRDLMDPDFPIHIADLQNQDFTYYYFADRYYYGNEYFYRNLSQLTEGNFSSLNQYSYSLSKFFSASLQNMSGLINSFDIHTTLENGFCFGRYNITPFSASVSLKSPVLQVGKFEGDFPFIIEVSGIYNSSPFSERITVSQNDVFLADTMSTEIWAGNYINNLEKQTQSNSVVSEIVDVSIGERVLSLYSAILCLEPSMGGEVCYDCFDETELTDISDTLSTISDTLIISIYPNPFNSQTNIQMVLPSKFNPENSSIKIFNILGEVIKSFDININSGQKTINLSWNGTNENGQSVSSGNYFLVVATPEKIHSTKLLLLK